MVRGTVRVVVGGGQWTPGGWLRRGQGWGGWSEAVTGGWEDWSGGVTGDGRGGEGQGSVRGGHWDDQGAISGGVLVRGPVRGVTTGAGRAGRGAVTGIVVKGSGGGHSPPAPARRPRAFPGPGSSPAPPPGCFQWQQPPSRPGEPGPWLEASLPLSLGHGPPHAPHKPTERRQPRPWPRPRSAPARCPLTPRGKAREPKDRRTTETRKGQAPSLRLWALTAPETASGAVGKGAFPATKGSWGACPRLRTAWGLLSIKTQQQGLLR